MQKTKIEILDTTLRDGEQTSGVSFGAQEKLMISKLLLDDLGVDRIEVASARVSVGEFEAVKKIAGWAKQKGHIDKIEVLGFVDGQESLNWINEAGCKVMNLLCKGSLRHCQHQLKKTPGEHIDDIRQVLGYAERLGININIYLEDWSNGIKNSPEYIFQIMDALKDSSVKRFMLPDTLGIMNPEESFTYVSLMVEKYPGIHFDFHAHNDYDFAVANVFSAVRAGIRGIHTTINGLGERAGNAPLSSVLAVLADHTEVYTTIHEDKINTVSRTVESYSGVHIPCNKPIIGENVFTQVAGVHADGDSKNNLYCNALLPERFGRTREYAMGKTSGKANIRMNLEALGVVLDEESMKKVTERVIELGDKKELVTQEDLPYIISDVLHHSGTEEKVSLLSYFLSLAYGLKPVATLKIDINGEIFEVSSSGDGQYDAFMQALRGIYKNKLNREFPTLLNYAVTIPPGGRTDAFVQTVITWEHEGKEFRTHGLDADQIESSIKATIKMLNIIEN